MTPQAILIASMFLWLIVQPSLGVTDHASLLQELGGLIKTLQDLYFSGCSLLVYRCPETPGSRGGNPDNVSLSGGTLNEVRDVKFILDSVGDPPVMIYDVDDDLGEELQGADINLASVCPVYIVLAFDIACALPLYTLENKDWDKYFFSRKHIIYTGSQGHQISDFLTKGETNTLTNLLFVRPRKIGFSLSTNTPYKLSMSSASPLRSLAVWEGNQLVPVDVDLFPDKLRDMHGYPMKLVTFHFPPRIFMEVDKDRKSRLYGVDIELVRAVSEALNFSMDVSRPSDGELWGWADENGTWSGLIGDLQYRRADIGVADLYIMEPYFAIIDMSISYDIEYVCFVNLRPGPLPQWVSLTLPFSTVIWGSLLLLVVIGMLFYISLVRTEFALMESQERSWFRTTSNLLLLLYGCVVNTPWSKEPKTSSLRLFLVVWALSFIILAVSYKGSLVSYLTVPAQVPPINTHRQLYAKGVAVGSIGTTLRGIMEQNADPFVRELAKRYEVVPGTKEGLRRTVEGNYAFLESRGFLDYTIAVDFTNRFGQASLHVMKEYMAPFGIGVAFPKYVPYIAKFNQVIRRLTEAGLAGKWMKDVILQSKGKKLAATAGEGGGTGGGAVQEVQQDSVVPLNLNHLQGVFLLASIGYGLSILVFLLEITSKFVQRCCSTHSN